MTSRFDILKMAGHLVLNQCFVIAYFVKAMGAFEANSVKK
jgi:hypothetical protein